MTPFIRVTQNVDDLSDSDDQTDLPAGSGGKGSTKDYEIPEATKDHSLHCADEPILDWFHSNVAIGDLEEFTVDVIWTNPPTASPKLTAALAMVLDLARENALDPRYCDDDEMLQSAREQDDALKVVCEMLKPCRDEIVIFEQRQGVWSLRRLFRSVR
jgi:hypothetical protein